MVCAELEEVFHEFECVDSYLHLSANRIFLNEEAFLNYVKTQPEHVC